MTRTVIARWESRRGKDWLEVYEQTFQIDGTTGYGYHCRNGGGWMGGQPREHVLESLARRVANGEFCSQKSPMRKVV